MTDSKKILAVCMSVVTATQVGAVALNQANADVSEDRISGLDRYETAADLAKQFKMAKTVVIASGENFADALCAAPLAKKNNAPIILVRKHSIDKKTISVLKQLKVKNAIIVGGENSISKKVASQIEINGIKIQRVAGEDRYKTSLNIAKEMGVFDEIAIANGGNFADALSISEIAAQKNMPILLTKKDQIDKLEKKYINEKNIKKSYLIGGTNQIDDSLLKQFPNAKRIAGKDRYETNINVLKQFKTELDFSQLYIASGVKYADALSGSVVSASKRAPLVLTGKSINENTENFLNEEMKSSTKITAFGGVKSVSQDIVNKIKNIAKNKNNSGGQASKHSSKYVKIQDENLKKIINVQLEKPEGSKITKSDMKKLKKLSSKDLPFIDNETGGEKYRGIRDLTGLEYATNLEWIDLSENNITDLYPISNLKKLTWLELDRNYINDLKPLESLKMLKHLNIYNNTGITDLTPISNLTNLEWIDMHYCARDINEGKAPLNVEKLTNLKKLWYLSIETNTVDDISFVSQLPSLTTFSCNNTYVTDLKEVQDIACNAYLNWENPDCFFNMYNQKLKDSVKVNVDNGKTEYKFKSPVTNNEQYENKVESMALSMYGQKVDAPGFEVKEKPDYLNVDFDHSTNEIVLKFDENNDLKTREGKVEVFLDYGYYSLTIVFDTNQSGKESISVTDNSGTEIGQLSSDGKLTIKDGVTEIAEKQFYTNEDIKSVEIPSSVKKIGKMAFSKCNNLESVKLEEGLTTIGDGAFYKDVKLKSFEMPNSVDSMGMSVFKECKALESIKMSKQLTEIGTRTFYSCEALNNVIIPENVTTIGLSAFENCNSLKNITFSEKLIILSDKAFKNCDLLDKNIDLKNISTLGNYVFSKCDGFTQLPNLEKVTTIGESLFSDCNGFKNVTIPTYMKIIPESIFNGCENLTQVIIPEGITNICNYAFYSCEKLQSVKIPGTVETIGEHVFYNCVSLTDILIEDGVKNIQYGVFLNCSALKEINIPQSVELINEWALSGCKNLENINIDANNKFYSDIDGVLFNKDKTTLIQYLDKKGDTYEIPNTVKTIAKGAFTDTNIRNLTIPEGVETLIHSSFMDCHNIEEIVLPSSIKRIENGAFSYCDKLKKINLPETIDFLGNTLFSGCSSLETVKLPTNINEIGENMFAYCSNLTNIEIPENVTIIKSAAFSGCEKLTSVKIPKNVTEIEALAFEGCSNLDEVLIDNIEGNVKMIFNSFDKNTNIKYLKEKEVVNEVKSEEESNVNTEIVFE